ncbi:MAG: tRNA preQ1(34) S-adenosylmethionine ribosyltransferase-isomerase QueA [Pseudomonadota bacterium]
MYSLSDYRYDLPEDRIAQSPQGTRDESRMLRLARRSGIISHHRFRDIESLLNPGDLLVINTTRVVPARLKGNKETGGRVEVFILDYPSGVASLRDKGYFQCDCLIRASKSPKPGTLIMLGNTLRARVETAGQGVFGVRFFSHIPILEALKACGDIPLPPYIRRETGTSAEDARQYQTVYAAKEGAVAAPTAGLHFTEALMGRLESRGIEFARLTLHVGYGTFVPVRVDDIRDHQIHSEYFEVPDATADAVNRAKDEGRRVIAVGTTSVRTLEYASDDGGRLRPLSGYCDLFIYPGYRFKSVDAMITNFHLPESTLLMLISAFAGREAVFSAYQEAIAGEYRFYSYGDAMLID